MATPDAPRPTSDDALVASGRAVVEIETRALQALGARLGPEFAAACRLMLACRGRVVCTGMGKSGHVARKIAATLASTGTPVSELMGRTPKSIGADALAVEAAHLMEEHKIGALVVVDGARRVIGALNIHDLLRARVV